MSDFVERLLGGPGPRLRPLAPNVFDPGVTRLPGGRSPAYAPAVQGEALALPPGPGAPTSGNPAPTGFTEFPHGPSPIEGEDVQPVSTAPLGPARPAEHHTGLRASPNRAEDDGVAGWSAPVPASPAEVLGEPIAPTLPTVPTGPKSETALHAAAQEVDRRAQAAGVPPVEACSRTVQGVGVSDGSAVSPLAREPQRSGAGAVVGDGPAPDGQAPSAENRTRAAERYSADSPSFPVHRPRAAGEPAPCTPLPGRHPQARSGAGVPAMSDGPVPGEPAPAVEGRARTADERPVRRPTRPGRPDTPMHRTQDVPHGSRVPDTVELAARARGSVRGVGVEGDLGGSTDVLGAYEAPEALSVPFAPVPTGPASSSSRAEPSPSPPQPASGSVTVPDATQANSLSSSPSNPPLDPALPVRTTRPVAGRPVLASRPARPTAPRAWPAPEVSTATEPSAETVVRVTIDRLVVHTTASQPANDTPDPQRRSRLSLEEYLGRRS
ncbi:hypothetical protein GCM10010207_64970 [Streptomyces atratus]|nr:hypothetical protein GCM10010207_64970 [Streptomyces atratus]